MGWGCASFTWKKDLPSPKSTVGSCNSYFQIFANRWMEEFGVLGDPCEMRSNGPHHKRISITFLGERYNRTLNKHDTCHAMLLSRLPAKQSSSWQCHTCHLRRQQLEILEHFSMNQDDLNNCGWIELYFSLFLWFQMDSYLFRQSLFSDASLLFAHKVFVFLADAFVLVHQSSCLFLPYMFTSATAAFVCIFMFWVSGSLYCYTTTLFPVVVSLGFTPSILYFTF